MQDCVDRYIVGKRPAGKVLDVGSGVAREDAPTNFRKIFESIGWKYHGLDLFAGFNVDFVAEDPFQWPIENEAYDAVISGQMLEHNSMFWLTFLEMGRVLKPGGIMIHIAPSRGFEHRAPTDCWRFYRDGMRALSKWAGFKTLEATTDWTNRHLAIVQARRPALYDRIPNKGLNGGGEWGDTVGVYQKPKNWAPKEAIRYMTSFLDRLPK